MKYTNSDFKNLERNYEDFLRNSEKCIKELKEKELINETINHPRKNDTN